MKEGAYDYLPKPFRPDGVVLTLRKAEERERLRHTIATLRAQLDTTPVARALVAESPAMKQALDLVARVADHKTTVLITGESGKIGRASCRERVYISVVAVSLKKKEKER